MAGQLSRLVALTWVRTLAVLVLIYALVTLVGGIRLMQLDGSWYFAASGLCLTIAAVLIFALRPHGAQLFGAVVVASLGWAVWDVGLAFWPLVSRLAALSILTILVASAYPALCRLAGWPGLHPVANTTSFILVIALLLATVGAFSPKNVFRTPAYLPVQPLTGSQLQLDWPTPAGNSQGHRFTRLDQITKNNLDGLKEVWRVDFPQNPAISDANLLINQASLTPLQIANRLFVCTPNGAVVALNVDTGRQLWARTSLANAASVITFNCTGLAYGAGGETGAGAKNKTRESGNSSPRNSSPRNSPPRNPATAASASTPTAPAISETRDRCETRLYVNLHDQAPIALDPATGAICADFNAAFPSLTDTASNAVNVPNTATAAVAPLVNTPLVSNAALIIKSPTNDHSVVTALAPDTGKLLWQWPATQVNANQALELASAISYDAALGLVYFSVAPRDSLAVSMPRASSDSSFSSLSSESTTSSPENLGVDESQGPLQKTSKLIALDSKTGKLRWEFTVANHDLWGYSVTAQPVSVNITPTADSQEASLLAAARHGEIFLLERSSGLPLATIKSQPGTIASDTPGSALDILLAQTATAHTPSQPHSVEMPSLGKRTLDESDMWGLSLLDQLWCRIEFRKMHYQGTFTPQGVTEQLQFPHPVGGLSWSALNVDPNNQLLLVKDIRLSARVRHETTESGVTTLRYPFISPLGIPCQAPPYATLSAVKLDTKQLIWQIPLGAFGDKPLFNTRLRLNIPIGSPPRGASLMTQSGVVFIAGTRTPELRALNLADGRELWRSTLPAGSASGPISYISVDSGVQYLLVPTFDEEKGMSLVAFALQSRRAARAALSAAESQTQESTSSATPLSASPSTSAAASKSR